MKAVIKTDPKPGIDVKEVDKPKIKPDEVLVEVKAVGICGTDVHVYEWVPGFEWLAKWLPVILGHEFSGRVIKVGEGVKVDVKEGDRVTSEFFAMACRRCFFCRSGRENLCPQERNSRLGLERNGAMAEYIAVPAEITHKVPNNVSYEEAALAEPTGVALHAVESAHITLGDLVAIICPGPIGLFAFQAHQSSLEHHPR
ncbi:MAG: putative L-threonine 3-dehydrogenase [Candidatus Bathyarchaeota archaeon BA1]|nr:MAG: putative L-threonine 3-dehydrogenase [Candidatus Bathyarchaeota archaeon BA1]